MSRGMKLRRRETLIDRVGASGVTEVLVEGLEHVGGRPYKRQVAGSKLAAPNSGVGVVSGSAPFRGGCELERLALMQGGEFGAD